jgi:hypothetical protein
MELDMSKEKFDMAAVEVGNVLEYGKLFGNMSKEPIVWTVVGKGDDFLNLSASWFGVLLGQFTLKEETSSKSGFRMTRDA